MQDPILCKAWRKVHLPKPYYSSKADTPHALNFGDFGPLQGNGYIAESFPAHTKAMLNQMLH